MISAIGEGTEIGSGGGAIGDEVLAFRTEGGYASAITLPASDVFAKPAALNFPEAANLLLASATAAEARMLDEPKAAALITAQRVTYDDHGAAVEYGTHLYASSRYTFEVQLFT